MKIAVIGAGAIGNLAAGYLKIKGEDVSLIGNEDSVKAIREKGLIISGARGIFDINIDVSEKLNEYCDLVILAVKTQDLDIALRENSELLKNSTILTVQNGIQADNIAARYLPKEKIISSIVMFGSTYLEPGKVVHNFEGNWIIGNIFGFNTQGLNQAVHALKEVFPVVVSEEIKGMKYLKIFVNANNCIPAVLGVSIQDAFSDLDLSRISIAIWKEGLDIVSRAGIKLVSLPDFPLERLNKLIGLPIKDAAKIFSGIMINLSKEPLFGSILQSIKRERLSEIDYINGEFVRIAEENSLEAPLNKKLVELVHRVEKTGKFFKKEELILEVKPFVSKF